MKIDARKAGSLSRFGQIPAVIPVPVQIIDDQTE